MARSAAEFTMQQEGRLLIHQLDRKDCGIGSSPDRVGCEESSRTTYSIQQPQRQPQIFRHCAPQDDCARF